ncbi:MAG: hypothetical protein AABY13_02790, partial [Nanoarchaeota archaeon]
MVDDLDSKLRLLELERKDAAAKKEEERQKLFAATVERMDAKMRPKPPFTSRYHVVDKHTPAMIAKDECTLDQLAHRMTCLLAASGIYHADPTCRMYVPRGTSMPSPVRYDFDRLRGDGVDDRVAPPSEATMNDMAAVFASFLRQSKVESEAQLRKEGRFKSWWLGRLGALVACSDNAGVFLPYLDRLVKEPLFEYTDGHGVKETHVLPFDVIVRTGTRAVNAIRALRAKGRTVTHYATIL